MADADIVRTEKEIRALVRERHAAARRSPWHVGERGPKKKP
jgi:hypothetical protein